MKKYIRHNTSKLIETEKIFVKINHPDIPDNYTIDEDGLIYNSKTKKNLFGTIDNHGYKSVKIISKSGEKRKFLVHRLVALTFISNPENKECIDHIDENKLNNCKNNLRWTSRAENIKFYNEKNKRIGFANKKLTKKDVLLSRRLYNKGLTIYDIWKNYLNKKVNYSAVHKMIHNGTHNNIKLTKRN